MDTPNIVLIGFMGAGKSTAAKLLAAKLNYEQVETDEIVERTAKMSIADIFAKYGEDYFRNLETEAVAGLAGIARTVVSCGGGVVLRKENVDSLKKAGVIILLSALPETVFKRVKNDSKRPLLKGDVSVSSISALIEKRRAAYEAAADITVSTDGKTPEEVCDSIIGILNKRH